MGKKSPFLAHIRPHIQSLAAPGVKRREIDRIGVGIALFPASLLTVASWAGAPQRQIYYGANRVLPPVAVRCPDGRQHDRKVRITRRNAHGDCRHFGLLDFDMKYR